MSLSHARSLGRLLPAILIIGMVSHAYAQNSFKDWICRVLGIKTQTYNRLSQVREDEFEPIPGARLVRLRLPDEQETPVWQCNCWSPAMISETEVAVLKRDGIWIVPLTESAPKPERPKIAASNIVAIIGLIAGQSKQLIVAQSNNVAGCPYILRQADLTAGQIKELADAPKKCLAGSGELGLNIVAGRLRNDKVLYASQSSSDALHILWKGIYTRKPNSDDLDYKQERLTPTLDRNDDGVDRYDPNWINDNEMIYVMNP